MKNTKNVKRQKRDMSRVKNIGKAIVGFAYSAYLAHLVVAVFAGL